MKQRPLVRIPWTCQKKKKKKESKKGEAIVFRWPFKEMSRFGSSFNSCSDLII
jgi:hypothetical protein